VWLEIQGHPVHRVLQEARVQPDSQVHLVLKDRLGLKEILDLQVQQVQQDLLVRLAAWAPPVSRAVLAKRALPDLLVTVALWVSQVNKVNAGQMEQSDNLEHQDHLDLLDLQDRLDNKVRKEMLVLKGCLDPLGQLGPLAPADRRAKLEQ